MDINQDVRKDAKACNKAQNKMWLTSWRWEMRSNVTNYDGMGKHSGKYGHKQLAKRKTRMHNSM
jgi:hypothetical protein